MSMAHMTPLDHLKFNILLFDKQVQMTFISYHLFWVETSASAKTASQ